MTGGKSGGVHCTDVTNASRTMLFNIHTLDWDPELCKYDVRLAFCVFFVDLYFARMIPLR